MRLQSFSSQAGSMDLKLMSGACEWKINYCIPRYIGGKNVWWIARKRKKVQLADINLEVTGSRGTIAMHIFFESWRIISGFNIGSVTGNPPILQIYFPHQYVWLYGVHHTHLEHT